MRPGAFFAVALAFASISGGARADVQHVVARGHTIDAIARRYHVSVKAIVDANHLKDPKHLKIGETLTIPGVQADKDSKSKAKAGPPGTGKKELGKDGKPVKPTTYAMRPKTPDVVHVSRLSTNEEFTLHVNARRGKVSPTVAKTAEQMMRSQGGLSHPIEPRLIHLLAAVSNHFGSRKVEIISGFRPYSPLQHTAHSNHNIGKAVDFRVNGVPNEVVRDYCRTLRDVGCGYYPNSTFVHMDVRDTSSFWIDYSRPGEPPRYNAPNLDADEGTSDVGEEAHLAPADETPDPGMPGMAPPPSPSATGTATPNTTPAPNPSVSPVPAVPATPSATPPPSGTPSPTPSGTSTSPPHATSTPTTPPPPPSNASVPSTSPLAVPTSPAPPPSRTSAPIAP